MINEELLSYVKTQLNLGNSESSLRPGLIKAGWNANDIDTVFSMVKSTELTNSTPAVSSDMNRTENKPVNQSELQPGIPSEEASQTLKKMGKFKASKMLFLQCFGILRKDKEIILFPILSSGISLIVLIIFVVAILMSGLISFTEAEAANTSTNQDILFYVVTFIFYVTTYFIITYFRVGLTAVAYERMIGGDIGFKDGINKANNIIGKIFVWSLISATVGMVLRAIFDRSKWLGKLVVYVLGSAWNILTFFIAPTLLLDNVSVIQSIKNSAVVFKKTWGETLITTISLSFFTSLIVFGTIIMYIILVVAITILNLGIIGYIIATALLVFGLIAISILSSSLSEIFKTALYSYARFGIIAEGFSPEVIKGAIKKAPQSPAK